MSEVVRIPLSQQQKAIIDATDFDVVSRHRWFAARARSKFYAHSNGWKDGRGHTIRMHRLIMGAPSGVFVDHINGDTLDNRRSNLRMCTPQENTWNQAKRPGSSKYKGVSLYKGRWRALICHERSLRLVGCFSEEEDAARAYDVEAIRLFGSFARVNFSEQLA